MDRASIFDAIVKLHKDKDDPTLQWPVTDPSFFEGNAADVIAPYLSGPGINIEDIGPLSENFEDRRGEPYRPPSLLEIIAGKLQSLAYDQRAYASPSNSDIDASVERMKQLHGITPVLQELVRREHSFRLQDEDAPHHKPREKDKREYDRLKKKRDDD